MDEGNKAPRTRVQLRQTCDGCSAAKVKCSKTHPACERCRNNQLQCVYSVSRRHGKQSWAKRVECSRAKAAAAAAAATVSTITPSTYATHISSTHEAQTWSPLDFSFNAQAPTKTTSHHLPDPVQFLSHDDDFSSIFNTADIAANPTLSTEMTTPSFEAFPLPSPTMSPADGLSQSDTSQAASAQQIPGPSPWGPTERDPSRLANGGDRAPPMQDSCEARAIGVLRSLSFSNSGGGSSCKAGSSASDSRSRRAASLKASSEGDDEPTFDKVLLANKAAMDTWVELMQCTCASCPHSTFLYGSIVAKIVFWYGEVAAGTVGSNSGGGNGGSCSSVGNTSGSHGTRNIGEDQAPSSWTTRAKIFDVRPTQIQCGLLDLDQEEQAALRRVVLLRELRRVDKTIRDIVTAEPEIDDDGDEVVSRPSNPHVFWISRITDELQDIIRMVESR